MSKRCFYETLSVERTASIEEIKGAYRKLAKELHPDRNPGDVECEHRFKEINHAYDILKDPDKRAAYDRFGHAGVSTSASSPGSSTQRMDRCRASTPDAVTTISAAGSSSTPWSSE